SVSFGFSPGGPSHSRLWERTQMDDATARDERGASQPTAGQAHVLALADCGKCAALALENTGHQSGAVDGGRTAVVALSAIDCVQSVAPHQFRRELAPGPRRIEAFETGELPIDDKQRSDLPVDCWERPD